MKANDIILLMLEAAEGTVSGKTLAHKRGYFLDKIMDVGLNYKPHYYGPYSPKLEAAIGQCKALGFVEQKTANYGFDMQKGFELKRYDYSLTEDGKTIVENIIQKEPEKSVEIIELFKKIAEHDRNDYVKLSLAAKTMFVLEKQGGITSYEEIIQEAKKYDWDISDLAVDKAAEFLSSIGLIEETENEKEEGVG